MSERVTTHRKAWRRPRLTIYTAAAKGFRGGLNRYGDFQQRGGVVIGAWCVVLGRCYSLTWAKATVHFEEVTR